MNTAEITERMRVLLDAGQALHRGEITQAQYDTICSLGIDTPQTGKQATRSHLRDFISTEQ